VDLDLLEKIKIMMLRLVVFILFVGLISSCRSTKKIGTAISRKDTATHTVTGSTGMKDSAIFIQNALGQIRSNQIEFRTFKSKINVDYKDASNKNYDVNGELRMYKDSAIWIYVNALLGIEAMRALITKDSVKIINKLDKTYTARSIDYLQEVTALPLTLKTLQDLLIGNPVFLDSNVVSYSKTDNTIVLLSLGKWFRNILTVNESDKLMQRSKLEDVNVMNLRGADIYYSEYETKKGFPFSTRRSISVLDKKKLDIKVEYKQYDFNGEVNFPFSVPKNYQRN
jgi:hypothetical protein